MKKIQIIRMMLVAGIALYGCSLGERIVSGGMPTSAPFCPAEGTWVNEVLPVGAGLKTFTVSECRITQSWFVIFAGGRLSISLVPVSCEIGTDGKFSCQHSQSGNNLTITGQFTSETSAQGSVTIDEGYAFVGGAKALQDLTATWTAHPAGESTPASDDSTSAMDTPETQPTQTLKVEPTKITPVEGISQMISNPEVIYRDNFTGQRAGSAPNGWGSCGEIEWGARGSALFVQPMDDKDPETFDSATFYYQEKPISKNQAVYVRFQYDGMNGGMTLGMDNYNDGISCDAYKKSGYYSFAMELADSKLSGHSIRYSEQTDRNFSGSLKMQEDQWFNLLLGYDAQSNYFIRIWKEADTNNSLTLSQKNSNFPDLYYFTIWVGQGRGLTISDFTILSFDNILQ